MTAWRQEGEDLVRAMAGGLLVGVPLVFTQETWIHGGTLTPRDALQFVLITYALNLVCVLWGGFRQKRPGRWRALADALEATALALMIAAGLLLLLAVIQPGDPPGAIIGPVAVGAIPISLGIAIANHLVSRDSIRTDAGADQTETSDPALPSGQRPQPATLLELSATAVGALFFAANIAPTGEIPLLAAMVPARQLTAIVAVSVILTYAIVFVADFTGQQRRRRAPGVFQHPVTETLVAYTVAVIVGVGSLAVYGRISPATELAEVYRLAVIMGLPAAIGGAAGRLAV